LYVAFEHVRLREVLLEGCEVALLNEEAALGVFGDAHDDVCVIGEQPELETQRNTYSRYHGLDLTTPLPPFSICKLVTAGRGEQQEGLQNS
jgi:hypothetical protein